METFESIKIVEQCVKPMPDGPIETEVMEIPEGEGIGHVEAPRGETFHYVRSDGITNRPLRHKVRAPSYVNVPTFKATCIGQLLADVTITMAAVDPCYSCTERTAVVDSSTRKTLLTGEDLIKLSQDKTDAIRKSMGKL